MPRVHGIEGERLEVDDEPVVPARAGNEFEGSMEEIGPGHAREWFARVTRIHVGHTAIEGHIPRGPAIDKVHEPVALNDRERLLLFEKRVNHDRALGLGRGLYAADEAAKGAGRGHAAHRGHGAGHGGRGGERDRGDLVEVAHHQPPIRERGRRLAGVIKHLEASFLLVALGGGAHHHHFAFGRDREQMAVHKNQVPSSRRARLPDLLAGSETDAGQEAPTVAVDVTVVDDGQTVGVVKRRGLPRLLDLVSGTSLDNPKERRPEVPGVEQDRVSAGGNRMGHGAVLALPLENLLPKHRAGLRVEASQFALREGHKLPLAIDGREDRRLVAHRIVAA